jgi:hypothetical protein
MSRHEDEPAEMQTPAADESISGDDRHDIDAWFQDVYGRSCPITAPVRGPLEYASPLHWRSAAVPSTFRFSTKPVWARHTEDFVHTVVWGGGQGGRNHSWSQQRGRVFVGLRWWVRGTEDSRRLDRSEMESCLSVAAAIFSFPIAIEAAALISNLGVRTLHVISTDGRRGYAEVRLTPSFVRAALRGDETGIVFGQAP